MLFNSGAFLLCFLPLTIVGFWAAGRLRTSLAIGWLVLASLAFYAFWKPAFTLVLLASLLVNFCLSRLIARSPEKRSGAWLVFGIVVNIGALCYFKYLFPFLHYTHELGLTARDWGTVVLPLGISFFTFTQIAYLVDLRQGEAAPEGFVEYAFFVTFFPHLIAGPILHHREIMPQVSGKKRLALKADDVALGLTWFALGLAKKTLLADKFALSAQQYFADPRGAAASVAWTAVLSYSMELYFDFSGYSDMAIGLARVFSIEFPLNFNSPYKSTSIIQFWQRWHMTLTRYLTLYLYNPISLAINRRRMAQGKKVSPKALATLSGFVGMLATPTIITMLIAGVWHGAGWQFLIFGLLHGAYLTVNHAWRTFRPSSMRPKGPVAVASARVSSLLLTYLAVLVGQVFFRASSARSACSVLAGLVGVNGWSAPHQTQDDHLLPRGITLVLVSLIIVWFLPNTQELLGQQPSSAGTVGRARFAWSATPLNAVLVSGVFLAAVLSIVEDSAFLYFQF
jgi:D-alanyl-lipoteichoic acid acyltransferase DltB (MBOAT superfamily)